jgi:hypothetical protein
MKLLTFFKITRVLCIMVFTPLLVNSPENRIKNDVSPYRFKKIAVHCRVSYFSNLFNVLDNLSQWGPRTHEKYVIYWEKRFGLTEKDKEFLNKYRQIRKKYVGRISEDKDRQEQIESRSPVPLPPLDSDLNKKFILLFTGAENLKSLKERMELLLSNEDENILLSVIYHFQSKFNSIWKECNYLKEKAEKLSGLMSSEKVKEILNDTVHFFGLESYLLPDFELHLLWSPEDARSYGQVVERYSLVEVLPHEDVKLQVDKHIHEICHYLYDAIPVAAMISMADEFFKSGQIEGPLAYNLIYESIAVAISQGLAVETVFPENFSFKKSWYGEPEIDAYAKALFPLIKRYFESGKIIRDGFATQAIQQYKKSFESIALKPSTLLKYCFMLSSLDDDILFSFRKKLKPTSLWARSLEDKQETTKFLEKYQGISGLVIATENDSNLLQDYANDLPQPLERLLKAPIPGIILICAQKRKINGYVFWIFSPKTRLNETLDFFLNLAEIPEEPIILSMNINKAEAIKSNGNK